MSLKILKEKLLIVEGRDEDFFFDAALRDYLALTDVQVLPIGGKTRLTGNLQALAATSGFDKVESIAVVRDADETTAGSTVSAASGAFQSVCSSLRAAGLACPRGHSQFAVGPPRIGVYIMPNGIDDGMLEILCLASVSSTPEFHCVDDFLQCLQGHAVTPNNLAKARAHAWLASRPDPGKRVGEAAQAGYWAWDSDAFTDLWAFIRLL